MVGCDRTRTDMFRTWWAAWCLLVPVALVLCLGCRREFKTLEEARRHISEKRMSPDEMMHWLSPKDVTGTGLIRDVAALRGIEQSWIRGWGVVVNLDGTGGSGSIVDQRTRAQALKCLIKEGVPSDDAKGLLKSTSTAIVRVLASVPVVVRKDQRINAYVVAADESRSLAGGLLCDSELKPYATIGGIQYDGTAAMYARGPVVSGVAMPPGITRSRASGIVPNGAVSVGKRRPFLQLHRKDIKTSLFLGGKINARFGDVCVPWNNEFLYVDIPAHYTQEPLRFLEVLLHLDARMLNTATALMKRNRLRTALFSGDAGKCRLAAIELEAWGEEGVPLLKEGFSSADATVKAECAAALVYRRDPDMVPYLKDQVLTGTLLERITAARKLGAFVSVPAPSAATKAQSQQEISDFLRGIFERHDFASPRDEAIAKYYVMTVLNEMDVAGNPYYKSFVGNSLTISAMGKEYGPPAIVIDADASNILVFGEDMPVKAPLEYRLRNADVAYRSSEDPYVVITPTLPSIPGPLFAEPTVPDLLFKVGQQLPLIFDDIRFMLVRMKEKGSIDAEVYLTTMVGSPSQGQ